MNISRVAVVAMSLHLTVKVLRTRQPAAQHVLLRHLSAQLLQVCYQQAAIACMQPSLPMHIIGL